MQQEHTFHILVLSALVGTCFSLYSAEQLPIPRTFSSQAVYYCKTKQLELFSCGYNGLFNAANFEHSCGFNNDAHRYSIFKSRCLPYIQSQGYNPKKTSRNKMTEYLAQNKLYLQPFYHLHFEHDNPQRVAPLITGKTSISYPSGTSESEIQRKLDQAVDRRYDAVIKGIQSYLNEYKGRTVVVHFLCYLISSKGVCHGVLVSLCQNATGRGLYLFDNMNELVYDTSDISYFLKYLCKTFSISSKSTFKGPTLPHRWPHLDTGEKKRKRDQDSSSWW